MGKRVEGRKKQKSVKANVTSRFSSKRKLSRMGKKVQAGKAGPNTEFVTRSAALRKLQITLKDFRRLCILKGIYPRVPSRGLNGNDKVYYDIKDISYIMHEPLLNKFREFKSFMKKIRKAAGRNQFEEARRKNEFKPKFTLDHLVKERYPRFIDALRDLDDTLCMIHLFAALPSSGRITTEHTLTCQKLSREWQYYVSKSKSLRKVFVSVKGVYFQAEILGEPITWLVPHAFTQTLPKEVDFRVMITFLEFYEVFMKFALFKLYHMKSWNYPPTVDHHLEAEGSCLLAIKADSIQEQQETASGGANKSKEEKLPPKKSRKDVAKIKAIDVSALLRKKRGDSDGEEGADEEEEEEEDEEAADITVPLQSAFSDLQSFQASFSSGEPRNDDEIAAGEDEERVFHSNIDNNNVVAVAATTKLLFHNLTFYVNREVPLDWCQLCITAFGGKLGWDSPASPIKSDDSRITHHVIDRPLPSTAQSVHREYIQPQWIFDSINANLLLPTRLYTAGTKLPPHLSPFVNDEKEGYMPKYREQINKLHNQGTEKEGDSAALNQRLEGDAEEFEEKDDFQQGKKASTITEEQSDSEDNEDNEESEESSEAEEPEEIEEVQPRHLTNQKKGPKAIVYHKEEKLDEETEAKILSKQMMKKKTKRLYDRMQYGIEKKQEQLQTLLQKRKAIDEEQSKPISTQKTEQKIPQELPVPKKTRSKK